MALEEHNWPGNIRELRNVIERAVALCPGPEIQLDDLPDVLRRSAPAPRPAPADQPARPSAVMAASTLARTKEEAEATRIVQALAMHRNNRLRAASELGISRMTLYKKMHRYGLMGITAA